MYKKFNYYILIITSMLFINCGGGGGVSDDTPLIIKEANFHDSKISGVTYICGDTSGVTDTNGTFKYTNKCSKIEFSIGSVIIGSIYTNDINNNIIYPSDLLNIDKNETNSSSLSNILQVLQSLDNDNNPYNGITIEEQISNSLNNLSSVNLDSNETNNTQILSIVHALNKSLINKDYAIAHYEDTLRKELNISVDTVAPAPAIIQDISYTKLDNIALKLYGEYNAKVFIDDILQNNNISFDNTIDINFNTAGIDGNKTFSIILQDTMDKNSSNKNIIIIKDTIAPTIYASDINIDENTTKFVIDINATDANPIKNYTLSGDDAKYFDINNTNGILSFKSIPDYDRDIKNIYNLTINVSDLAGNIANKEITVSVNHINDEKPSIDFGVLTDGKKFIEEKSIFIMQVSNIDIDKNESQIFTYTIVEGEDSSFFNLTNDGNLTFTKQLDDQVPEDNNKDNIYKVKIKVNDGTFDSDIKTLSIEITPKNENAPILIAPENVTVTENYTDIIFDLDHTDADKAVKQNFTYSISGNDVNYFIIDSATGEVKFKDKPDYETQKSYSITAIVNDGPHDSIVKDITITLNHLNDIAPIITSKDIIINENQTSIYAVTYTDADKDENQKFTFTLSGDDNNSFNLNSISGKLSFIKAPDYEDKKSYSITLNVNDGVFTTSKNIIVSINHLNDETPVITTNDQSINENQTFVTINTNSDKDQDENQTFTYSIENGEDASLFNITSDGNLTFINPKDYEKPQDKDKNNIYKVGIKVFDGVNTSAIKILNISILPVNDIAPIVTSNDSSINENNLSVMSLSYSDADLNQSNQVFTFKIDNTTNDSNKFEIKNGILSFKNAPDYEIPTDKNNDNIYQVGVKASDGKNTGSTKLLNISVLPVNDIAPVITSSNNKTINESNTNTTLGLTLTSTDSDKNQTQTFTYSILGSDASLFNIDSTTGSISFKAAPNYEKRQSAYKLIAKVFDGVNYSAEQNITININHLNDELPLIDKLDVKNVNENTSIDTIVVTAKAIDADINEKQTITYTLAGEDVALFNLNSKTGDITFKEVPDFENPKDFNHDNVFKLTIFANDGINDGPASNITINLINLDDVPALKSYNNSISGTVNNGSLAKNALVILEDIQGNIIQTYTDKYGYYSFDLTSAFTGPFILKSYLSTGEILYSYNDGEKAVANLTPITTLIVKDFVINLDISMKEFFENFKTYFESNKNKFDTWFNTAYTTVNNYFKSFLTSHYLTGFNHIYNSFTTYGYDYDRLLKSLTMKVSGENIIIKDNSNTYTSTNSTITTTSVSVAGIVKDYNGNIIPNTNVTILYDGIEHNITTDTEGKYTLDIPAYTDFDIVVYYGDSNITYYNMSTFSDSNDTNISNINIPEAKFVNTNDTTLKNIDGYLVNTNNINIPISDAIINIRTGYNNHTGNIYKTTTTNSKGKYSIDLKNGYYTFEYSKYKYTSKFISVYVNNSYTLSTNNIQLITDFAGISSIKVILDPSSDTGFNTNDNYTNDTTPTIVTDQNAYLLLKNNAFQTIEDINVTSSDHKFTLSTLEEGTYSIVGTDSVGNALGSNLITFTIDTTTRKPTINLLSSSDTGISNSDNITRNISPKIAGEAEADSNITIKNGSTILATTTTNSSGEYSVYLYGLTDGVYNLKTYSTDKAGNTNESDVLNIIIDTKGSPITNISLDPNSDTGLYNHDKITNDTTPTIIADQNVTLNLIKDGNSTILASYDLKSLGTTTITLDTLDDGTYKIYSGDENNNTDTAGNILSYSYMKFTIDTIANAPSISLAYDSGKSSSDNIINDSTPSFNYTKESNSIMTIKDNNITVNYSYSYWNSSISLANLEDGNHSITASIVDIAGNKSSDSKAVNILIDTVGVKPAIITVENLAYSGSNKVTNDTSPTINIDKNQSIRIYSNDGTLLQEHNVSYISDNKYITTLDTLTDGIYKIETGINDTDVAGNTLGYSYIYLKIDTTITVPTLTLNSHSDSGISNSDNITNDNTPRLDFTTENGASVVIKEGNTTVSSGTYGYYYKYFTSNKLSDGNHTFILTATDEANNTISSAPLTITIDTIGEQSFNINIDKNTTNISNLNNIPNGHTLDYSNLYKNYWYRAGDYMFDYGNYLYIDNNKQYIWTKHTSSGIKSWGNYSFNTYKSATSLIINDFNASKFKIYDDSNSYNRDYYKYGEPIVKYGLLKETDDFKIYYHQVYNNKVSINRIIITNSSNPTLTVSGEKYYAKSVELSNIDKGSFVQYVLIAGKDGYHYTKHKLLEMLNFTNNITPTIYVDQNTTLNIKKDFNTTIQTINRNDLGLIRYYNNTYKNFIVSQNTYNYNTNLNTACKTEYGNEFKIADWNDIVSLYNKESTLNNFFNELNITTQSTYFVSLNNNEMYTSNRHYFITRHDQNKPDSYYAHSNINNYELSLGSWDSSHKIICYNSVDNTINQYSTILDSLYNGIYSASSGNIGKDIAGNDLSYSSISFIIDTNILKPTIDLNSSSDTGASNSDYDTKDNTPTIIGTGEAGAKIIIIDELNTTLGITSVNSDGNYSVDLSELEDGNHTLKAVSIDAATNSKVSDTLTIQIDTFGDTTISLNLDTSSDNGSDTSDNITSITTPTISTDRATTIKVIDENNNTVQEINTSNNRVTLDTLSDGIYTIAGGVDDYDNAGNYLSYNTMKIIIDTTKPTFTSPSSLGKNSDITAISLHVYNAATSDATIVAYTLSGDDSSYFTIDSATGIITLNDINNAGKIYSNLTITATDIAGNSQDFNISITPEVITPLETTKIIASDISSGDNFGTTTAVSGDYIIVGSPYDDDNGRDSGSAYIYKKQTNGTTKLLAKLRASDASYDDNFGSSVAISGNYITIGAYKNDDNGSDSGSAYVFKINSDSNISEITKLTASDADNYDYFGSSIAISGDYITIGAYRNNDNGNYSGSAYVFKINSDSNISEITKLTASDADSYDLFGSSIAISRNYIVVGSKYNDDNDSNSGSAYVFKINSDDNISEITKLIASDASYGDYFGYSVSISGNNIVIGTNNNYYGNAYVYQISPDDNVKEITKLNNNIYRFGNYVSINDDYMIVGSNSSYTSYLYKVDNEDGVTLIKELTPSSDTYTRAVAISGTNIVIGNSSNSAYLFDIKANKPYIPTLKNKLTHNESLNLFKYTIPNIIKLDSSTITYSLSGDDSNNFILNNGILQSTNIFDYENPTDTNSDNIYNITLTISDESNRSNSYDIAISVTDNTYLYNTITKASDVEGEAYFGNSMDSDGNYTIVGAYKDDANGEYDSGAAYLYKKDSNGTITQLAKLIASDGSRHDYFGYSVAISKDYIVVGSIYDDIDSNNNQGSAYVFKKNSDDTISQIAKLTANDGSSYDYFGYSVAISEDYIVVGSKYDDDNGSDSGSAYVFKINSDNNISQIAKLRASDASYDNNFGYSVAISNNYITIGDYSENTYLFKINSDSNISEISKIEPSGNKSRYGNSVDIDNNYIVIGNNGYSNAYVFKINSDDTLSELATLSDNTSYLGQKVKISGNNILLSSYSYNSATLFTINSDSNITSTKQFKSNSSNNFGSSISISGDDVIIGESKEDTSKYDSGAIHLYTKDTNQQ